MSWVKLESYQAEDFVIFEAKLNVSSSENLEIMNKFRYDHKIRVVRRYTAKSFALRHPKRFHFHKAQSVGKFISKSISE